MRLPTPADLGSYPEGYSDDRLCYWKDQRGVWMLNLPHYGGCLGNLSQHTVVEHENGTITVSPSILISARRCIDGVWRDINVHGYLERGAWRDV